MRRVRAPDPSEQTPSNRLASSLSATEEVSMDVALAQRVDCLLAELCSRLGYCSARRREHEFEALVPIGVDAFSDAVIAAEGLGAEADSSQVRHVVARHFERWASANGA